MQNLAGSPREWDSVNGPLRPSFFSQFIQIVSGIYVLTITLFVAFSRGQTWTVRILPVTVERETGQRKFTFPHSLCVCSNTRLEWLRNSDVYIRKGCHIFRIIPCWCASLFQSQSLKRPLTSLSGKNLANNGHSSYECKSLAQSLDTSTASNFLLVGANASESDFVWIPSGVFIILYLPKKTFFKDTCLTYV